MGCLVLGFVGGLVGSNIGSDDGAGSDTALTGVSISDAPTKGAATPTTKPRTTSTIRAGIITVPNSLVIPPVTGAPGPPGPQGPAGPAGKDGAGVQGIQWIEVGGEFSGCCGEWLASCPAGTTAMTWQARGLAGADISYAGQSIYSNNPNDWMFRASDDRSAFAFSDPVARFSLGCLKIG